MQDNRSAENSTEHGLVLGIGAGVLLLIIAIILRQTAAVNPLMLIVNGFVIAVISIIAVRSVLGAWVFGFTTSLILSIALAIAAMYSSSLNPQIALAWFVVNFVVFGAISTVVPVVKRHGRM